MKLFLAVLLFGKIVFAQATTPIYSTVPFKSGKHFSYMSNYALDQANTEIEQAIIVVHGSALNFETYFKTMQVLSAQQKVDHSTLAIAPHYRTNTEDPLAASDELLFTDEGWLSGDPALNDKSLSSFDVIDQFINLLENKNNFPNLKFIIVTGHSAGGQLTQRYAIGTLIDQKYPSTHFRFIVVNPGSYAYLNNRRPVDPMNPGLFAVPTSPGCNYNDYKYGLDNLNKYMSQNPTPMAIHQYIQRDVIYMLGEADKLTDDDFDLTCPAVIQGPYRYLRGLNFKASLDLDFPGHKHQVVTVPGIGHTQWGMYASPNGVQTLFHTPY